TGVVALEELVPVRAPHYLDDVPARAAEHALEFVDDALVAAHRSVQPLQIAVDDKDEVVQLLARRHRDRTERIDFVRLAIANEGPHLSIGLGNQATAFEITHEACLVEGVEGPNAHRPRWEAPEVRHQP